MSSNPLIKSFIRILKRCQLARAQLSKLRFAANQKVSDPIPTHPKKRNSTRLRYCCHQTRNSNPQHIQSRDRQAKQQTPESLSSPPSRLLLPMSQLCQFRYRISKPSFSAITCARQVTRLVYLVGGNSLSLASRISYSSSVKKPSVVLSSTSSHSPALKST